VLISVFDAHTYTHMCIYIHTYVCNDSLQDGKDGQKAEEQEWMKKDVSEGGHYLYTRDSPSEFATLVLDGKAEIVSGRDHFTSVTSRWAFLCPSLLEFRMHKGR
jgi:hypothetical protein